MWSRGTAIPSHSMLNNGEHSMTIYLYKKTHNKTGLQYLGQTTRDPYKYPGSGLYWSRHLKEHGNDVTTEILKECKNKDEVKEWGLYYSQLWNVVENKEWANLRPEDYSGNTFTFKNNNPMKKPEIIRKLYSNGHHMKDEVRRDNQRKIMLSNMHRTVLSPEAMKKKSGENHYLYKNPKRNPMYDHTVYTFENVETSEIWKTTAHNFCQVTGASRGNVSQLVRGLPTPKTVKGWKVP